MREGKKDIETDVKAIIREIYLKNKKGNKIEIKNNHLLANDLGFDSLEILELIVKIEKKFNLEVPDEYLRSEFFKSVNSTIKLIGKVKSNG